METATRTLSLQDDLLTAEDSFSAWLKECTQPAADWQTETSADLFASWKQWAERAAEEAGSRKRFADLLQGRGYPTKKGTGGVRCFEGIRLARPDYTDDPRSGG